MGVSGEQVRCVARSAEQMRELGGRLAALTRAGDVVALTGPLGAGKTTLTAGFAEALGVRGAVTSPTFVLSRVHPPLGEGPALVHVDAYRLSSMEDFDGLDLDMWLPDAVVVIEWGGEAATRLSDAHLSVVVDRSAAPEAGAGFEAGERVVTVTGVGDRWGRGALAGLGVGDPV